MSDSDITLAAFVARYRYHGDFDSLETCIESIGQALVPPRPSWKWGLSSTAKKFGLSIANAKLQIHEKKLDISCGNAHGNDVRNIIAIIRAQCRGWASDLAVDTANECQKMLMRIELKPKTQHAVYSRWITSLVECMILALSHQYSTFEHSFQLIEIVVDSIHTIMAKSKGKFTGQLVKMFIEVASARVPEERALLQISLLQAMSALELSKTYISRRMIPKVYCVAVQEVLQRLLRIANVYVTTYDAKQLSAVRSALLASILYFDQVELMDEFNSMSW